MDDTTFEFIQEKFAEKERLDELVNFLIHFVDIRHYYVMAERKSWFKRRRLFVGHRGSNRKYYLDGKEVAGLLGIVAHRFNTVRDELDNMEIVTQKARAEDE